MNNVKIIYAVWGYSMRLVDFYIVLEEGERSMKVEKVEAVEVPTGFLEGVAFPDICKRTGEVFRVLKRKTLDGAERLVSSFGHDFRVQAHVYTGESISYNHCD